MVLRVCTACEEKRSARICVLSRIVINIPVFVIAPAVGDASICCKLVYTAAGHVLMRPANG